MSSDVIQLLVLAGIAVFLIFKLRSVLGTREGFEKPRVAVTDQPESRSSGRPEFEVIESGPDRDIVDHVDEHSRAADALGKMKEADRDFHVGDFLQGARGAYEMILMAFENGDLKEVQAFLDEDVYDAFLEVIARREDEGLTVDANFVGVREVSVLDASFEPSTSFGEVTVKYVGELTSVVRNAEGEIIEGSDTEIRRQKDVWTFGRTMGANDPNWQLLATGE